MRVRSVDHTLEWEADGRPFLPLRGFDVREAAAGRHELALWGALGPRWAGRLFQGLARHRVSVVRGTARRIASPDAAGPLASDEWRASFELERATGGTDPVLVDYLELLLRDGPGAPGHRIALRDYVLHESASHGGSLFLEVAADDRLGFLAALLERLAFLSLVPVEMWIETRPEGALDRFLVRTEDGRAPSLGAQKLLAAALDDRLLR